MRVVCMALRSSMTEGAGNPSLFHAASILGTPLPARSPSPSRLNIFIIALLRVSEIPPASISSFPTLMSPGFEKMIPSGCFCMTTPEGMKKSALVRQFANASLTALCTGVSSCLVMIPSCMASLNGDLRALPSLAETMKKKSWRLPVQLPDCECILSIQSMADSVPYSL